MPPCTDITLYSKIWEKRICAQAGKKAKLLERIAKDVLYKMRSRTVESEKKCPLVIQRSIILTSRLKTCLDHTLSFSESGVNRAGVLFIITMFFALAFILSFFIDWRANRELTWSGFATGGILLVYVCLVLPFWFHRPDAIVLVNVDFAVVALFLLYINFATNGSWFLGFAFPATLAAAGITTGTIAVVRYVRRGYLFITAGVWAALGVYAVLIEYLSTAPSSSGPADLVAVSLYCMRNG